MNLPSGLLTSARYLGESWQRNVARYQRQMLEPPITAYRSSARDPAESHRCRLQWSAPYPIAG